MILSRYRRPRIPPSNLILQERDYRLLRVIQHHRFLTSEQVQALVFEGVSIKRVQQRLRQLWDHRLLDRHFVPTLAGGTELPASAGRPYYTLATRGAALVAQAEGGRRDERPRAPNPITIGHDGLAIEFLVALQVACRRRVDVRATHVEPEWMLWQKLRAFKQRGGRPRGYLVPDAAVTLTFPQLGRTWTFYLEVVRADVKGGNRRLQEKFRRYATLHHDGFFRRAFGHAELRAVIIATTSARRAEHFRLLAASLPHGRRLFWFGTGQERARKCHPVSTFTPDSILLSRWTTTDGQLMSLLPGGVAPIAAAPHF